MYWDVGKYISKLCVDARFGDKVISDTADFLKKVNLKLKGFDRTDTYTAE